MMPEPEPASWPFETSILTTEGSTCWATCSTEPSAAVPVGVLTTDDVVRAAGAAVELEASGFQVSQAAAPPTPAAPPTTREAATTPAANPLRPGAAAGALAGPARGAGGRGGRVVHERHDAAPSCDQAETGLGVREEPAGDASPGPAGGCGRVWPPTQSPA